ncbi:YtxH domain-containing protein [Dyadobacter sp. CY312]|uniref:YtxH domain-containing protein n=1 Tax=Dyadobacter sp. CY312 TaxID=2907303 RepID=UPI001F1579FA|nr:YtxH domain-containing protein [Dyadobacter sp. CY312]MCE7042517.1 YtxH domain-containing protein [Dyadobacter sp. CY312]
MKIKKLNRYDESIANKEFFAGLLAGVALGAIAGILLAPRSGKDTLDILTGAVSGHAEDLESELSKAGDKVGKNLDKVSTKANSLANEAEDKLNDYADQAEDKVSEVSGEANSIVDRIKSRF